MTHDTSMTPEDITARIADEVAARIAASHPEASRKFLRLLVRLYTDQALGLAPPPGEITQDELAGYLGVSRSRVGQIASGALARAWKAYHTRWPELL